MNWRTGEGRAQAVVLLATVAGLAAAGLAAAPATPPDRGIRGFHRDALARQRTLERLLQKLPDAKRIAEHARILTEDPHVAGTPENDAVARYIRDRFKEAGLQTEMKTYSVYMGFVNAALLEQVEPVRAVLTRPEEGAPDDKDAADPRATLNWNGYSPSGDLTREVVYANYANPEDFARLEALGIAVKDRLLLVRYFHGYRGGKAQEAERRGAAGIIFYSDPADDGFARGDVYPDGPWGPESHFQRGAAVYDYLVPGDPLTPGWPSFKDARRIRPEESRILTRIPSVPIAWRDAQVILKSLKGPVVPHGWQGGIPVTYHLGPGPSRVHMKIDATFGNRTITDVIGVLTGADEPEKKIILGNHHDAWVYGAADPISGTATMLELARVAGELAKQGFRPRRTLVFGNWDAEEWTLTGSTEWGEEFAADLGAHGVACLNVDGSADGGAFVASAVPSLRRLISDVLRDVRDPKTGRDLYSVTAENARAAAEERMPYLAPTEESGDGEAIFEEGQATPSKPVVEYDILGSGSDYTVFFNHLGMPSLDASFEGPYGVYHSILDNYYWMTHFGDPGFVYHTVMVPVWGMLAYRLANADVLPFEEAEYPKDVAAYVDALEREVARSRPPAGSGGASPAAALPDLADLRAALRQWGRIAADLDDGVDAALSGRRPGREALAAVNDSLMQAERDLLDEAGLPGRPWFRHLIYAPYPSYAAETIPGLREAVLDGDVARARDQADRLATAIRARAATVHRATRALMTAGGGAAGR